LAAIPLLPGEALVTAAAAWPQDAVGDADLGCAFRHRCPYGVAVCASAVPPLTQIAPGHWAACHRAHELLAKAPIGEL
jgi:oligopeptide/dipeptide ABC transporter ATP-binding protein